MSIEVKLTQGNLNHNHFYLTDHLDFFPADVIGGSSRQIGEGTPVTLIVVGLDQPVQTDIAGDKRIFRQRGWVRDFYQVHNAKSGDWVIIEKEDDYTYRVSLRHK